MSSYQTKSRPKVKPMLKKLTQSEKNSLDLDRPAVEQNGFNASAGVNAGEYNYGMAARSSHDVVFTGRRGLGHNRSASGTSQFSNATAGSGHRAGSFVHPFQQTQTPRPYTPPLALAPSYQNSLREGDDLDSPALTEDEAHDARYPLALINSPYPLASTNSLSNLRSPTNRATSTTGSASSTVTQHPHPPPHPPLRIQTKNSSSRLALAASTSSLSTTVNPTQNFTSPVDTMSPSSLRSSFDKGFRIRSRSEVEPRPRQETIHEARRKFQEREQAKEEKAAREEVKALERKNNKEAREKERQHRRSSASDATRRMRSKSDLTMNINEKHESIFAQGYDNTNPQSAPYMADVYDECPRYHKQSAKKKTHTAWSKFFMWVRTRFLRMGKTNK